MIAAAVDATRRGKPKRKFSSESTERSQAKSEPVMALTVIANVRI